MKKGEMLDKMLHIAVNAHHGQFDKGGNPSSESDALPEV
jgi:hypothetical protein